MSNNNGNSVKRTVRERKFIDAYIDNNGNATESYLSISPKVTRDSARELGKRMLQKVSLSIVELLDEMGLTDPVLSQKLIDGLSATREVGIGEDRKEKLDHTVIVKYLDMALKLKAKYPADRSKLELTGKGGEPIMPCVITTVLSYKDCPLKDTGECPMEKEVKRLQDLKYQEEEKARIKRMTGE